MQAVRHAHTKTSARALLLAALLAALALPFSARPARAATITISDQASCVAAGGSWERDICLLIDYTVVAGDVLQTTVTVEFESSLTNDGTINLTAGATVGDALANHGSINITNSSLRLRATSENNGTINVIVGVLEVFPSDSVLANQGTINVHSDGDIWNDDGTINNQGTITLACGGSLSGSPIQGNPVQAPADCPAGQAKQS